MSSGENRKVTPRDRDKLKNGTSVNSTKSTSMINQPKILPATKTGCMTCKVKDNKRALICCRCQDSYHPGCVGLPALSNDSKQIPSHQCPV